MHRSLLRMSLLLGTLVLVLNTEKATAVDYGPDTKLTGSYNVNVWIVVQNEIVEEHGKRLRKYIESVVAGTAKIFASETLDADVKVSLAGIKKLPKNPAGLNITTNLDDTQWSFSHWVENYRKTKKTKKNVEFNVAALMLKFDMCTGHSRFCGRPGPYMGSGSMCGMYSSLVFMDEGVHSAYNLAHQLGLVLGMEPDESDTCVRIYEREGDREMIKVGIMSENQSAKSLPWKWSRCSVKQMESYVKFHLESGDEGPNCLLKKPKNPMSQTGMLDKANAGQIYDLDFQCSHVQQGGEKSCAGEKQPCSELMCRKKNGACESAYWHWFDGTPCGDNKWCQNAICTDKQ